MNKFDIYFIRLIIFTSLLIFFIIISFNFPPESIISDIMGRKIIYTHEYMSGDDDVAFSIAAIIFLPVTIIYIIKIIMKNKKEPLIILLITIILQIIFTNMFLEYGDIHLNILYGTIIFKLWIITFGLIIIYTIINIVNKIKNNSVRHYVA